MRTLSETLTFDTRLAHLYRPLIRNLALTIAGTLALAATALIYFDQEVVQSLSKRLLAASSRVTEQELEGLFNTSQTDLEVAARQLEQVEIAPPSEDRLYATLAPFFEAHAFIDSVNLADTRGNEYVVIRKGSERLTRRVDASDPATAHWKRRLAARELESWTRQSSADPASRPWFQGAMTSEPGKPFWTAPYALSTTKAPGISVSERWAGASEGSQLVVAFNVSLADVSRHTTRLRPSPNGMTVVFDGQGQTLGLPPDPRFEREPERLAASLSPLSELGVPALERALAQWKSRGQQASLFRYSAFGGRETWWASFTPLELDAKSPIWTAVLVPERDLFGTAARLRNLSLAGIGLTGILIAAISFLTSMRSIRRQMREALDAVQRRLGQYQLAEKIGAGGNGTVYRATHALLRRPTAIKLMHAAFATSPSARARFEHEVQLTSQLTHPNTIAIFDYGQTPEGTLYYAMEFLPGRTLEQVVRYDGPQPAERVIHLLQQMAASLSEAHAHRLIHRDVKPSNAILCERGGQYDVVKMVDFGLVQAVASHEADGNEADVLVGTPLYMAPETILQPGQASPRSDLYALGAVGYYLLTARNVFEGESAADICARHLHEQPVPPSQRSGLAVPDDLEALLLQCLSKDPSARPESAIALREALLSCRDAGAWTQRRAVAWWRERGAGPASPPDDSPPPSNTERLLHL